MSPAVPRTRSGSAFTIQALRAHRGPRALDGVRYAERPFDRDTLIAGYRTTYCSRPLAHAIASIARSGDSRALTLAVEIIHRGVARGFDTYDVMSPLADVVAANDPQAVDDLNSLCDEDPRLALSIVIELIDRADDEYEIGYIAAGPLEDLIAKHRDVVWDEIVVKAHADQRFVTALQGVWLSEGEGSRRLNELRREVESVSQ